MKVIIAEKPSVAKEIAKIVGANTPHRDKANGYLEGNGYAVTWAFGHLVGLDTPEQMGYNNGELPMLPDRFPTHILNPAGSDMSSVIKKQMKTIETLFKGAEKIIVATDAGREGELIFRYIYEQLGSHTPFERLWISSLTDEAIRKGLKELRSGADMAPLSEAAHARSEADWITGYNASRALRLSTGFRGILSLGRVQTPVLGMICERTEANKNFVPTPFWQIGASLTKNGSSFKVLSKNKYDTEQKANAAAAPVKAEGRMKVKSVEKKQVVSKPPLLYDLTALQRAANGKYGMTADETLKVAQSLYEKKYLSYPRTGSRYISEDVFRTIPALISKVAGYGPFAKAAAGLAGKKLCRKSVNDAKITDHHALIPTDNIPSDLSGREKQIWEMVCGRMLEAFGEDCLSDRTTALFESAGQIFSATGSVVTYAGWRGVFGFSEPAPDQKKDDGDEDDDAGVLPPLAEGESLPSKDVEVIRKTDKPLPIYTDATLLGEMETCGKKIDDEEMREALKDVGIGTPATRAATIEILIKRGYIVREGKKLLPTELGCQVYSMVRGRRIADVNTSAQWEHDLALIEQGKLPKGRFDKEIRTFAVEIIDDLKKNCKPIDASATGEPTRTCPVCGRPMKNMKFSVSCDSEAGGCGLKINREIAGKKLPASAIEALAAGKNTAEIKGFKNKEGKPFNAKLRVNKETKKLEFVFAKREAPAKTEGKVCPCCGKALDDNGWKLSCPDCGLEIWKTMCKKNLTETQLDALLSGKTVEVKGMTKKDGKKFDAKLKLDKDAKKIVFAK